LVIEQFNVARVLKRFRRVGVELSSVEVPKSKCTSVGSVRPHIPEHVSRDYSKLSVEELEAEYSRADYVERQGVLFYLKKRGVNIYDFQRKHDH
jgi:hypothetical protein